jgi:uncharacterized protein YbaR (Trm112 family)
MRMTWDQHGDCLPIRPTVRSHSILQRFVFVCCPFARRNHHWVVVGDQGIIPSVITLLSRSTRNKHGDFLPILITLRWHSIPQLLIFVCCPVTRTYLRCVDAGAQFIVPSLAALAFRFTRNQRHRAFVSHQSVFYLHLPSIDPYGTCCHRVDIEGQGIVPSLDAICQNTGCSFDPESTRQLQSNWSCPTYSYGYFKRH